MDESRRKRLTAYCPEIELIFKKAWPFDLLSDRERDALIMSALIARISEQERAVLGLQIQEAIYELRSLRHKVSDALTAPKG